MATNEGGSHPPMDRPKPQAARSRPLFPILVTLGSVILVALMITSMMGGAEAVERDRLLIDTVTRGPLIREIVAPGVLAPAQVRTIPAPVAGRIEERLVEVGDSLEVGGSVVVLTNRDELRKLLEIEQDRAVAESDLADLRATLRSEELRSENELRRIEFEMRDAERRAEASAKLASEGLVSKLEADSDRDVALELAERLESERERHQALQVSATARLDAQRTRLERARALEGFQRTMVESMTVRTPVAGVVREIELESGTWVEAGQKLARLVEPGRLKAVLQVSEAAARDVLPGQAVRIDARGTRLSGTVDRVAPTITSGTVAVDVALEGNLPDGLRPDLSVEGTIVLTELDDVLSITRPSSIRPQSRGALYRLVDGHELRRTELTFGVGSAERVEIREGASAGDELVIAGLENETRIRIGME